MLRAGLEVLSSVHRSVGLSVRPLVMFMSIKWQLNPTYLPTYVIVVTVVKVVKIVTAVTVVTEVRVVRVVRVVTVVTIVT